MTTIDSTSALPAPVEVEPGRDAWPEIFGYAWSDEAGEHLTPLPPPGFMRESVQAAISWAERATGGRMPHPSAQPRSWPYRYVVHGGQLAAFAALVASGAVYGPRHTGHAAPIEDHRAAPES